jgi:hypothetical protein
MTPKSWAKSTIHSGIPSHWSQVCVLPGVPRKQAEKHLVSEHLTSARNVDSGTQTGRRKYKISTATEAHSGAWIPQMDVYSSRHREFWKWRFWRLAWGFYDPTPVTRAIGFCDGYGPLDMTTWIRLPCDFWWRTR